VFFRRPAGAGAPAAQGGAATVTSPLQSRGGSGAAEIKPSRPIKTHGDMCVSFDEFVDFFKR
jgi:hypothetical protein